MKKKINVWPTLAQCLVYVMMHDWTGRASYRSDITGRQARWVDDPVGAKITILGLKLKNIGQHNTISCLQGAKPFHIVFVIRRSSDTVLDSLKQWFLTFGFIKL